MKKLKFNSTLNNKKNDYQTYEVEIEKVVTLYGVQFEDMKNHTLDDNPWIDENRDLMYIDDNHTAHCILFLDSETGDGIITEAEGFRYARKSQFIPNAKALLDSNEMTAAEIKLHNGLKRITDMISELAHCGETSFDFEEMLEKSDMNLKMLLRNSVIEMLQSREDIKKAEVLECGVPLQPDIKVEAKEMQPLTFYCPLHIVTESDEEYDWDEEVMDEMEIIPPECALDCEDEINSFIKNYLEPEEANRGLMVYFDDNPSISEAYAVREYGIKQTYFTMPKTEKKQTDVLNSAERKRLENYLLHNPSNTNTAVLLCLFTGLRIGELCGLKWGDIDFENGTLTVSRTVQRINKHGKSEVVIGSPKSKTSVRVVPIPEFLLKILKRKRKDNNVFIITGTGKPTEPRTMQNRFKSILRVCDIRDINFHLLRHTYANSEVTGTAMLKGYELQFRHHATVEPEENSEVPILLWELDKMDESILDKYEGWPKYYRKENVTVELNGEEVEAMIYIMNGNRPIETPSVSYYDTIEQGYRENGLDLKYLETALANAIQSEILESEEKMQFGMEMY